MSFESDMGQYNQSPQAALRLLFASRRRMVMVSAYKSMRAFLWQKQLQNEAEASMKASTGVLRFMIRVIDELDTLERAAREGYELEIAEELKRFTSAFEASANASFERLKDLEAASPRLMAKEAVR
jgi:hypothetical protein